MFERFRNYEVRAMRRLLRAGETGASVAWAFGTTPQQISLIKHRRIYRDIPDDSPHGRKGWHVIENLPTVEEVHEHYAKERAREDEKARRAALSPGEKEAEDEERAALWARRFRNSG